MSNEELALLIQQGKREYVSQLWEQTERFISMKAGQFERHLPDSAADVDDLKQSGYFAMLEAVRYYDAAKGYKFLTYLSKTVQKRFYAVAGIRTSRRDATRYADSLDAPASAEYDNISILDTLEDERAQTPLCAVIDHDYLSYADSVISRALERVNPRVRRLVVLIYFEGRTITEAAGIAGYTTTQAAEQAHYNALRTIRCSHVAHELQELLSDFGELDIASEGMRGTGARRFRETWESATERAATRSINRHEEVHHENSG